MTMAEKIKFCRKRKGITQGTLAEMAGINPVSIRKYETNKNIPKYAQVKKLAKALDISPQVLTGINENFTIETVGDFMGFLIFAIHLGIVQTNGERSEDGAIDPKTFSLKINPFIADFFFAKKEDNEFPAADLKLILKNFDLYTDFIKWEKLNYCYKVLCEKYGDTDDEYMKTVLANHKTFLEKLEIELQCCNAPLVIKAPADSAL